MGRRAKQAGSRWERDAAKELSKHSGEWKRIPGSGALSHTFKDVSLSSDLVGKYPWWVKSLRGEAKYGYGGQKQMAVKREWFTKNRKEALEAHGLPCLLIKFRDVMGGDRESAKVICFNFDTWIKMMEELEEIWEEYLEILERTKDE